ncbi:tRNA (adenosine(37)-N6)-threonylcarbamoyltransferase complex ATPase subunit type 1 TsaE [Candidatus Peregrinibacteria bacterium CG11_big_fil_rev_8_21_14_0_20_41_10]|nr:MAG: tRNA (adenosine(37)-N6)-threonylcarbamoyltransferase complex ATPase subunit type 1 TsaE [Candidatus Peregrinibacteria bacterium CG11_big_fil_rev_8_21_14_0_20_41_10]PIZ74788.1 MAG: tRNA (adenosine(37)-N6)-threonylcarbamoyltransferase complex ATPase subunit type 1 TsaE [Candidatus Peregrinibacteria bacterium CG_4_10_14_0_2_um_filter_41_8]PJC37690.1 MAG: tRNA (adenosine(37)-N6)-threonylcarbamoyltransferase complex ATPase subunit type 1 TsaE [Candidatus Peregrinibacteria bacterium CG_4_9_14_0
MSSKQSAIPLKEIATFINSNFNKEPKIYLLSGDLGSGKTTFVKHFLNYLDIPTMLASSPTYTLIQTYTHNSKTIHHVDLYRLKTPDQLEALGIFELLDDQTAIMFIEWPELILPLKQNYTHLNFYHTKSSQQRLINIEEISN